MQQFSTPVVNQLKSCIVEILGSDPVKIPHLPVGHFPIPSDTTDITFEHSASCKCCVIKRKQVPIEPGFAITHRANYGNGGS